MASQTLFNACNRTELYQFCRKAGIVAHPSASREELIALLLGERESTITEHGHPIDSWRHGLMGFVEEYWSVLEAQLTCPAKTRDPRACFTCVDAQVITCVVNNAESESLIRKHRKTQ